MRIALAFCTKDQTELSRRTIEPLLHTDADIFWLDGSNTPEGKALPHAVSLEAGPDHRVSVFTDVRGGPDAAIVYALTTMVAGNYNYVGLVESDVLFTDPNWLARTLALFEVGAADGLVVGAASARCFVDRILVQRDAYALMHNLGAGMAIFTRRAARLILDNFRTTWNVDNRAVFSMLSGIDVGRYWAFKGNEHWLCADWGFDKVLAANGLASLALTPSPVEMIGQNPPLADQGLILADREIDEFRNDDAFARFRDRTQEIRHHARFLPPQRRHRDSQGDLVFAHQLGVLGAASPGALWALHWNQGFGPFAWKSRQPGANLVIEAFGPCNILLGGGKQGGRFRVTDSFSGFEATPNYAPGAFAALFAPSGLQYRKLYIKALDPGVLVHGIQCTHPQPLIDAPPFDWYELPKVE